MEGYPKMMMTHTPSPYDASSELSYYHYQANYLRNSRAIGVLWAVFTMCYAIINVTVFVQPQWLGDTETSKGTGYFGLWKNCRLLQDGQDLLCEGRLDDFTTIPSPAFRAATVFVALSVGVITLCLLSFILFFFLHSSTVFHICGWLQAFNALCLCIGCLLFPVGWDSPIIKEVCGPDADNYSPGQCGIRWSYILAMIGVVDCFVLSILAFVLGTRYVKLLPDQYLPNGSLLKPSKGEINSAFLTGGSGPPSSHLNHSPSPSHVSRPTRTLTMNPPIPRIHMLHPGLSPDHERYSEYSARTGRSHKSNHGLMNGGANHGHHGHHQHHPHSYPVSHFQL